MQDPPSPLSVERAVARAQERNPVLRAFVTTRFDEALAEAQTRAREAPRGALHRVPYSLKDTWDTAGMPTTGGSHRFRARVPVDDSPAYRAFRDAGAVLLGKTNLSDMGMVPESASYVGGVARNPIDPSRTPGGSSGGAAAAVRDGMVCFDWGSDIGGSIRIPAAFCGVLGLRLSSVTWPVEGHFPTAPEALHALLAQGPITRDLHTMREVLRVAATTMRTGKERPFSFRGVFVHAPRRLGAWPTFREDVSRLLSSRGVGPVLEGAQLGSLEHARRIYDALWCSHFAELTRADETLSLPRALAGVASGIVLRGRGGDRAFHPSTAEVFGLIALGRALLYRDRAKALGDAQRYRAQTEALWDRGYLVVMPTCVYPAPRHGRANYNPALNACASLGNLVDATGLAMPFGAFDDGLPRSLSILGPPGSEACVLDVAARLGAPEVDAVPSHATRP